MRTPPEAADCPLTAALAACGALRPWFEGPANGRLWVAFSGGADSTALLHGLRETPGVRAVHVDHGLHPESPAWARHCAEQAAGFGTAFECHRVRLGAAGNQAAAARRARYDVWRALLRPGDVLALAHHADDQAETRLWQLFTGRAPGGMPAARALGAGSIVRPLLSVRRSALRAYAVRHGLRWLEDPSNADQRQDRSYIRHRVLPVVEARFPAAVAALGRHARPGPQQPLAPLPAAAASGARIKAWLAAAGLPLGRGAMTQIERQSLAAADRNPSVAICPGTRAWRYQGVWHLVRDEAGAEPRRSSAAVPASERWPAKAVVVGVETPLPAGTLGWRAAAWGLRPGLRLRIHGRLGGERIHPTGRNLGKTVKALLRERRVPPWQRQEWPLLYAEQGQPERREKQTRGKQTQDRKQTQEKLLAVPDIAVERREKQTRGKQTQDGKQTEEKLLAVPDIAVERREKQTRGKQTQDGKQTEEKLLAVPNIAVDASAAVCGGLLPTWRPRARTLTETSGPDSR